MTATTAAVELRGSTELAGHADQNCLEQPVRFVEPKGIYALEAMACGLPVVVPDRGAFPEMIASGGGGLLCQGDDAGDLAAKLAVLLEHPDKATELGQQGRDWVEQSNSREAMARATDGGFKRVASGV